jgi:signal peptidase I
MAGDRGQAPGGGDQPPEPRPAGDQPGSDQSGGDGPGDDRARGGQPGGDQTGGDRARGGQPGGDQSGGDQPREAGRGRPEKNRRSGWQDLLLVLAAALVLTLILKIFVVEVFSIPSQSMENTLLPGERVVVNKLVYHFRGVARGDIVVFNGAGSWDPPEPAPGNPVSHLFRDVLTGVGLESDGTIYIKRVIGLPGDHVACCDAQGRVTVNGVPLAEQSYVFPGDRPSLMRFSLTVPPGRLWVMGDNRSDSADSRYHPDAPGHGTIPESAVIGRAFVVVWPLSRIRDLPIPATFGQPALRAAALPIAAAVAPAAVALPVAGIVRARRRRR